jgi:hypothetical protein
MVDMKVLRVAVDADLAMDVVPSRIAGEDESGSVAVDWERDTEEPIILIDSIRLSGLALDAIWAVDESDFSVEWCSGK